MPAVHARVAHCLWWRPWCHDACVRRAEHGLALKPSAFLSSELKLTVLILMGALLT